MKIIKPSVELVTPIDGEIILKRLEQCGRVCYKSEDKITEDSAKKFVANIIKRGHEAVLEHCSFTLKFICDRGVSHEIVRHRMASYCQESTRYVDSGQYRGEVFSGEDVVRLYKLGLTAQEISKLGPKNYTANSIYTILHEKKITKEDQLNWQYFDNIDSHRKAYLLGFIQADGSVRKTKTGYGLSITQQEQEMWPFELLIQTEIGKKFKAIKGGHQSSQKIQITNSHLVQSLFNKGIIQNKTYDQTEKEIELLWNSIPEEFKFDFIHGLFDGDGHISFGCQTTSAGNPSGAEFDIAGNNILLNKIKDFIKKEVPGNYTISIKENKTYSRLYITYTDYIKQICNKMLSHAEAPLCYMSKTIHILQNTNIKIPIAQDIGTDKFVVIYPNFLKDLSEYSTWIWLQAMFNAEQSYCNMRLLGATPQEARAVLPNSLKTEVVMTANLREWRHFFKLRCDKAAQPQMREVAIMALDLVKEKIPIIFDDIIPN